MTELAALGGIFATAWTSRKKDERVFARVAAPVLALAGLAALAANIEGAFFHLPAELRNQRARVAKAQPAYEWVKREAPAGAAFYSNFDPLFYLQTGRKAMRLPMPAAYAYEEDRAAVKRLAFDLNGFAGRRGLGYLFLSQREPQSLLNDEERDELWRASTRTNVLFQKADVAIIGASQLGHAALHEQEVKPQQHQ